VTKPRAPLNALRAFEAATRLGSLTAAARELAVTPGAVSHHMKSLEDLYGVALLRRLGPRVMPTPEGARLAEGLASAFRLIDTSLAQLRPAQLTLSASSTVTMNWLIPRLNRFKRRHPDSALQLNVNYGGVDFIHDGISVALRIDSFAPPAEVIVRPLGAELIGPVCAPELTGRFRLSEPADLAAAPLLSTRSRPATFQDWRRAIGATQPWPAESTDTYEHFYMTIQAAICGLGVACVPRMLVEDELRAGRLVAPFGFAPGPYKLVLWIAPHARARADVQALVGWLEDEFGAGDAHREPL